MQNFYILDFLVRLFASVSILLIEDEKHFLICSFSQRSIDLKRPISFSATKVSSEGTSNKMVQKLKKDRIKPIRRRKPSNSSDKEIKDLSGLAENERRYPKRKRLVNYAEAEVPDDDHYLCKN